MLSKIKSAIKTPNSSIYKYSTHINAYIFQRLIHLCPTSLWSENYFAITSTKK